MNEEKTNDPNTGFEKPCDPHVSELKARFRDVSKEELLEQKKRRHRVSNFNVVNNRLIEGCKVAEKVSVDKSGVELNFPENAASTIDDIIEMQALVRTSGQRCL